MISQKPAPDLIRGVKRFSEKIMPRHETMSGELKISVGQHSDKGRKETNQDFHGVLFPKDPLLSLKGIAVLLADGISSSKVSRVASESPSKVS